MTAVLFVIFGRFSLPEMSMADDPVWNGFTLDDERMASQECGGPRFANWKLASVCTRRYMLFEHAALAAGAGVPCLG